MLCFMHGSVNFTFQIIEFYFLGSISLFTSQILFFFYWLTYSLWLIMIFKWNLSTNYSIILRQVIDFVISRVLVAWLILFISLFLRFSSLLNTALIGFDEGERLAEAVVLSSTTAPSARCWISCEGMEVGDACLMHREDRILLLLRFLSREVASRYLGLAVFNLLAARSVDIRTQLEQFALFTWSMATKPVSAGRPCALALACLCPNHATQSRLRLLLESYRSGWLLQIVFHCLVTDLAYLPFRRCLAEAIVDVAVVVPRWNRLH